VTVPRSEARADDELADELARAASGADLPILGEPFPCALCELRESCAARLLSCEAFGRYVAGAGETAWRAAQRDPTREAWEILFRPEQKPPRAARRRTRTSTPVSPTGAALLTTRAAAARVGVDRTTLSAWCREGAPCVKSRGADGKRAALFFDLSALEAWIAANRSDRLRCAVSPEQRRERHRIYMRQWNRRRAAAAQ
jgi:hypothetical protein